MQPRRAPEQITIDFRQALHPTRGWILGVIGIPDERVELLTIPGGRPAEPILRGRPTRHAERFAGPSSAELAECSCPAGCPLDHENE